jgi:ubiquinone/menaquinone biosynthesis C-methylase UbiE
MQTFSNADSHDIKKRLVDHYDVDAKLYHHVHYIERAEYSPLAWRQAYVERTLAEHRVAAGVPILDIGCGPGELVLSLLRQGFDARGIDISAGMVDVATRLLASNGFDSSNRVARGDIERLAFPDQAFDVVVAAGVIEYQKDDTAALTEMRRVLKPNGLLILNVTNRYGYVNLLDDLYRRLKKRPATNRLLGFLKERVLRKGPVAMFPDRRTHSPWKFDKALAAHGLRKVGFNYFHFSPLPMPLDSVFASVCRPAGKSMERLSRNAVAVLLAGGYIVVARREG